ncbi:MAG: signal peptidase II [Clostridiales bacterium]|nr:signal peptidase II [Clostridiales bacterium]
MRRFGWIALAALVVDQLTKLAARQLTAAVTLIPGVVGLRYAENTGMAFSLFSGRPWLLGLLSAALIVLGFAVLRRYRLGAVAQIAAMLMLGGAAGNMIDRLFIGYVVDMIEVLFIDFAIFNVADAALTVGCVLMAWSLLFRPKDWSEKHGNTEGDPV